MTKLFNLLVFSLLLLTGCSVFQSKETREGKELTFLYQSNRQGEMEPCGCSMAPYGGIDREANVISEIQTQKKRVFFTDSGNLFAPVKLKAKKEHYQLKAQWMLKMLNEMGLEVFAPGPNDYALGLDFLKKLQSESKFVFVSTNVTDAKGTPIFEPYTIIERGGVRVAFLSATPSSLKSKEVKVVETSKALDEWVAKVSPKADMIVLLSQLGNVEDVTLLESRKDIQLAMGSDLNLTLEAPYYFNKGKTLLVDPNANGFRLGKLIVKYKQPFTGFYSEKEAAENRKELIAVRKDLLNKPTDEVLISYEQTLLNDMVLEPIAGSSQYVNEILAPSEEKNGKPNKVTQLKAEYKEAVRLKAIGR